jgi:transcriptional regulator with XRE-family HTH domain
VVDDRQFFRNLGQRVREIRKRRKLSQEDMIGFGFSARHWQQIEAGRPITVKTLLRISEAFEVPLVRLVRGLEHKSG